MKKILILVLLSSIILMSSFVIALDQSVKATISEYTNVSVTPDILDFGTVLTCSQNNPSSFPITFSAVGSNTNVNIEFTSVTAGLFDGISVAKQETNQTWVSIGSKPVVSLSCTKVSNACTYTNVLFDARLNVPCGIVAGVKSGAITYTITSTTPV